MSYIAVFTQEKDRGFSVSVPALPGCFSQGDTFEEAKKNIEEAIELYLEDDDSLLPLTYAMQIVVPIDIPMKKQHT